MQAPVTSEAPLPDSGGRPAALPEIVIRPPGAFAQLDLRELVAFRGTLWRKARQKVRIQYDDMVLGLFWAVARPLIMVGVIRGFRDAAKADMGVAIPYTLYVFSGLAVWFHFTDATMGVAMSLQRDAGIIQKVYYPRLITPLSYLLGEAYNLAIAAVPLAILMASCGEYPGWNILLLPVVLAQLFCLTLGVGLVFSSLVLASRDWERILRFTLYVGLWLSPVIYSPSIIAAKHAVIFNANPMSGTLLAMRAVLFGSFEFPWGAWLYSCGVAVLLVAVGLLLFQRSERNLADNL